MASFADKHIYRSKLTHHISVLSILFEVNLYSIPFKRSTDQCAKRGRYACFYESLI